MNATTYAAAHQEARANASEGFAARMVWRLADRTVRLGCAGTEEITPAMVAAARALRGQ